MAGQPVDGQFQQAHLEMPGDRFGGRHADQRLFDLVGLPQIVRAFDPAVFGNQQCQGQSDDLVGIDSGRDPAVEHGDREVDLLATKPIQQLGLDAFMHADPEAAFAVTLGTKQ